MKYDVGRITSGVRVAPVYPIIYLVLNFLSNDR